MNGRQRKTTILVTLFFIVTLYCSCTATAVSTATVSADVAGSETHFLGTISGAETFPEYFNDIKPEEEAWWRATLVGDAPQTTGEWNNFLNDIEHDIAYLNKDTPYEKNYFLLSAGKPDAEALFSAVCGLQETLQAHADVGADVRNIRFDAWALACKGLPTAEEAMEGVAILYSTERYIATFDPQAHILAGSDYQAPINYTARTGKDIVDIDRVYDYDFEYLSSVRTDLQGVDRNRALAAIFDIVTKDSETDTERHCNVLKFLDGATLHNWVWQPMEENGQAVYDPLILLDLHEMRTGGKDGG